MEKPHDRVSHHFPVLPADALPAGGDHRLFLLLDRLDAPGWLWGVVGAVMACVWVAWIAAQVLNDSQPIYGFGEIKRQKDDK